MRCKLSTNLSKLTWPWLSGTSTDHDVKTIVLTSYVLLRCKKLHAARAAAIVEVLASTRGRIFVSGVASDAAVGKRMVSAMLAAGVPSNFVPILDWNHGAAAALSELDVAIFIDHSGILVTTILSFGYFGRNILIRVCVCGCLTIISCRRVERSD